MGDSIEVGSVVVLKSGGPKMTVETRNDSGSWLCKWFDAKGVLLYGSFGQAELQLLPTPTGERRRSRVTYPVTSKGL